MSQALKDWAMSIKTQHICPPIPDRRFDWVATQEGYEPGDPVGYGKTEQEAINDLKLQQEVL
jgi:hypothetical protein